MSTWLAGFWVTWQHLAGGCGFNNITKLRQNIKKQTKKAKVQVLCNFLNTDKNTSMTNQRIKNKINKNKTTFWAVTFSSKTFGEFEEWVCDSTHILHPYSGFQSSAACSEEKAFVVLFALAGLQRGPGGHLKHLPHTILRLRRAFHVAKSSDPISHVPSFFSFDWLLFEKEEFWI